LREGCQASGSLYIRDKGGFRVSVFGVVIFFRLVEWLSVGTGRPGKYGVDYRDARAWEHSTASFLMVRTATMFLGVERPGELAGTFARPVAPVVTTMHLHHPAESRMETFWHWLTRV